MLSQHIRTSSERERKIHIPCALLFQSRSKCLHLRSSSDNMPTDPSKNKLGFFSFKVLSSTFSGMRMSRFPIMGVVDHHTDSEHCNSPSKEESKSQGCLCPDPKSSPGNCRRDAGSKARM